MSATTLRLPTLGKEIARPWFLPSAETLAAQRKLMASRFFLVRIAGNDGIGEGLRCTRCGGKHPYLSLMCCERPFSGLAGGLFAYYRAVGDFGLLPSLSPAEHARYDALRGTFDGVPDLATAHPELARSLDLAPTDEQLGAFALGVLDPIPVTLARKLQDRINLRGLRPPLALPGLEGG